MLMDGTSVSCYAVIVRRAKKWTITREYGRNRTTSRYTIPKEGIIYLSYQTKKGNSKRTKQTVTTKNNNIQSIKRAA